MIAGLILAGGQGRRMGAQPAAAADAAPDAGQDSRPHAGPPSGTDKALLTLGGNTLVALCAKRLGAQTARCAISANGDPARFAALGLPVLPDPPEAQDAGPLAGVLAGLDWAASIGAQGLVSAAVDTPFFAPDLAARLSAQSGFAIASAEGRLHPTFGYWPAALRAPLAAYLAQGHRRLQGFAEAQGARGVVFAEAAAFFNINTPEDLARAKARHAGAPL
ncbi:molybdenum cofactor guanylyltransferase [Litorivita sp. NS0012-18]